MFIEFGCKLVDRSRLDKSERFRLNQLLSCSLDMSIRYPKMIDGWINHFIWGASYSYGSNLIGGKSLRFHIDSEFRTLKGPVYLATMHQSEDAMISAEQFTIPLALRFLDWFGYCQEVLVIDPQDERVLFINEDMHYTLYCRNPDLNPRPFPNVTDDDLTRHFEGDLLDHGPENVTALMRKHMNDDLIAHCEERAAWARAYPLGKLPSK